MLDYPVKSLYYRDKSTLRGDEMHLVSLSDETALKQAGVFYRPGTLRKWHSIGENPRLFKKIRKRLFIDLNEWQKFLRRETGG